MKLQTKICRIPLQEVLFTRLGVGSEGLRVLMVKPRAWDVWAQGSMLDVTI